MKQFFTDQRGVALMEFGLIFPILMLIFAATIEISKLFISYQQVDKATNQMADIVTQNSAITCQRLEAISATLPELISRYDASNGKIIYTLTERVGTDNPEIIDQYESGGLGNVSLIGGVGGAPDFNGSFALQPAERVLVVELFHEYQPILGNLIEFLGVELPDGDDPDDTFYKRSIYVARAGGLRQFGDPGC